MLNEKKVIEMSQVTKKQKGASMIEYALVVAAVVAIGAVVFGGGANSLDKAVEDKVKKVATDLNS